MENSLDPIHVEWLHQVFSDYVLERLGRPDLKRRAIRDGVRDENPVRHEKIGFTVFEHGITKRRVMTGSSEDDEDWRIGHPIVFPNILRTLNAFQIRVPMDDTHTLHFWYTTYPPRDGIETSDADAIPCYAVPVPGLDAEGQPEWPLLDNNSGQDVAMWYTQGDVADRAGEHLGRSDQGVITYRNLLRENMEKVERGQDPMNVFRNPLDNECVWLPVERNSFRFGYRMPEGRAGQSGKYSPILRQAAVRAKGEDVLLEPVHTF
jgi:5,5'-dehydrodivanillate O-demethylase